MNIPELQTIEDADFLITKLENLKGELYKSNQIKIETLDLPVLVKEELLKDNSLEEIVKKIEYILDAIKKTPIIRIILSITPNKTLEQQIVEKLRDLAKKTVFVKIEVNPFIVSGAIVEYDGKYLDYSISKKINELIKNE